MKATLLALALVSISAGAAVADGIFPDCEGEGCNDDFSCNNMGGCSGASVSCDARGSGAVQQTSVASSLALLAFVSYRVTRKKRQKAVASVSK